MENLFIEAEVIMEELRLEIGSARIALRALREERAKIENQLKELKKRGKDENTSD